MNPYFPGLLAKNTIDSKNMLIQKKAGHIDSFDSRGRITDWLSLEWHETNKRILRKRTRSGKEVALKFLDENPSLTEGDILYEDEQAIIAVTILPCETIVIKPVNMFEMASVCYEIGNKHLPLFFEKDELLVPFEAPLFKLLEARGYEIKKEMRKLIQPVQTTVTPHLHEQTNSLFSRIMRITTNE